MSDERGLGTVGATASPQPALVPTASSQQAVSTKGFDQAQELCKALETIVAIIPGNSAAFSLEMDIRTLAVSLLEELRGAA